MGECSIHLVQETCPPSKQTQTLGGWSWRSHLGVGSLPLRPDSPSIGGPSLPHSLAPTPLVSVGTLGKEGQRRHKTRGMGVGHCPAPEMPALGEQELHFWPVPASPWTAQVLAHYLAAPLMFCSLFTAQIHGTLLPGPGLARPFGSGLALSPRDTLFRTGLSKATPSSETHLCHDGYGPAV